jgi:hypothetical protein
LEISLSSVIGTAGIRAGKYQPRTTRSQPLFFFVVPQVPLTLKELPAKSFKGDVSMIVVAAC